MGKTLGKTQTECGFESQYSTPDNYTVHIILHNVTLKYNIGTELNIGAPGVLEIWGECLFFSGSWGALVIIFRDLGSKLIVLGILGTLQKSKKNSP